MKDQAIDIARTQTDADDGLNALREYVQSRILGVMQEAGAMRPLAFSHGFEFGAIQSLEPFEA